MGWVVVRRSASEDWLDVTLPAALAEVSWPILTRLRALFDLDANPASIDGHLGADPLLGPSVRNHPGLRVPGAWSTFELASRAVLGQQVSVTGASTLASRLSAKYGQPVTTPFAHLNRLAPSAGNLATASVEDIAAIGLPRSRATTLRDLGVAAERGDLDFGLTASFDEAIASLRRVRGIGEWTAQYVAMRALRFPDAFPAADLGVRKALALAGPAVAQRKTSPRTRGGLAALAHLRSAPPLANPARHRPLLSKMKSTHFTQMDSPLGTISLCGTERGLAGIFMEDHRHGPSASPTPWLAARRRSVRRGPRLNSKNTSPVGGRYSLSASTVRPSAVRLSSAESGRRSKESLMASRFPMANSPGGSTSQPRFVQSVWPTDATRSRSSYLVTESSGPTVNSPATAVVWTASGGCWIWKVARCHRLRHSFRCLRFDQVRQKAQATGYVIPCSARVVRQLPRAESVPVSSFPPLPPKICAERPYLASQRSR